MLKKQLIFLFLMLQSIEFMAQNFDYKIVALPSNDIIVVPKQKRIYASVPSSIPKYGNSICRINPNFGTIESSIWVGSEPNKLAISDDEKYLYIAFKGTPRVKKLNLLTNQIEQEIFVVHDTLKSYADYFVGDIAVMPQHPNTYIIARQSTISYPSYAGIVAMDSLTPRPTKVVDGYDESTSLLYLSDSTKIFGISNNGVWYKYAIDSSGITKIGSYTTFSGYAQNLHYSAFDSLYYANDGYKFDLRSGLPVGKQFANATGYSLADPLNANIYYFTVQTDGINVKIYNRKTQIPIDQFTLPVIIRNFYINEAVNWGTSGQIALRGLNDIVIFNPCTSTAPKPVITEGGNISVCTNTEVKLTASVPASRYYWTTNDTTKSIKVKNAGSYSVGIADSTGCINYSDPTTITTIPLPSQPYIYDGGTNSAPCIGTTIKLVTGSSGDPNGFEWSNGKTGQFIEETQGTQPIVLSVVAISSVGCRSIPSDSYQISFFDHPIPPKPVIVANDTVFCAYGLAKLKTNAGYKEYKWSTGQTTQSISFTPYYTQKYWVSVVDESGCRSLSSDSIQIRVKDTPYKPTISKVGNVLSVFNTSGIQWFMNGIPINGATNRTYTATANGFYAVQITGTEGCGSEMSDWVNVTSFTSVNYLSDGQKFDVFPNPVHDILSIYTKGVEHGTVSLTDTYGRTLWTIELREKNVSVPITDFASGIYMVGLKNAQGRVLSIKKIVKM